jgi:hypothetical protein
MFSSFTFGSLFNNPVLTVLIITVVPFTIFVLFVWRFALPRVNRAKAAGKETESRGLPAQDAAKGAGETPSKAEDKASEDYGARLAVIEAKLDRLEATLVKAGESRTKEVQDSVNALVQKLDDVVLAVKSAQADASSPFNQLGTAEQHFNAGGVLHKSLGGLGDTVAAELGDVELKDLLLSCAVLEVLEYNRSQVDALYSLGVLSPRQIETVSRVEKIVERYSPNLKARDLALIAYQMVRGTEPVDPGLRRILEVVQHAGD